MKNQKNRIMINLKEQIKKTEKKIENDNKKHNLFEEQRWSLENQLVIMKKLKRGKKK